MPTCDPLQVILVGWLHQSPMNYELHDMLRHLSPASLTSKCERRGSPAICSVCLCAAVVANEQSRVLLLRKHAQVHAEFCWRAVTHRKKLGTHGSDPQLWQNTLTRPSVACSWCFQNLSAKLWPRHCWQQLSYFVSRIWFKFILGPAQQGSYGQLSRWTVDSCHD